MKTQKITLLNFKSKKLNIDTGKLQKPKLPKVLTPPALPEQPKLPSIQNDIIYINNKPKKKPKLKKKKPKK